MEQTESSSPTPQSQNGLFTPRNLIFLSIFAAVLIILSTVGTYVVLKSKVQKTPISQDISISPTSTIMSPTVTTDEMKDWKTYTNETWGVSFDYPFDWTFKNFGNDLNNPTQTEFYRNGLLLLSVIYHDNPKNLSLNQIDEENALLDKARGTGIEMSKLNPKDAVEVILPYSYKAIYQKEFFCEPSMCQRYIIPYMGRVIEITIFPREQDLASFKTDISHILSTFKFSDQK